MQKIILYEGLNIIKNGQLLSQKNSYPTRITLDLLIFIILDDLQAAFLPDTIPPPSPRK